MPYKSEAQRKYFHANKAKLESQGVNISEWDKASKGRKLPNKIKTKMKTKWEGSKADKAMDKKQGAKEGSKKDKAIDKKMSAKKKDGKTMLGKAMKKLWK